MDVSFTINQTKNRFNEVWSTEPTMRIDRLQRLKEYNNLKRSGFNKKIDNSKEAGYIDKPISSKQLSKSNLRTQTAITLNKIIKEQQIEEDLSGNSLIDMNKTFTKINSSIGKKLNMSMVAGKSFKLKNFVNDTKNQILF